jgi:hypothetical protein
MPSTVSGGRFLSQPQLRRVGSGVLPPQPQVPVEGLGGAGAERHGPRPATFTDHVGDPGMEVDVGRGQVRQLGQPDSGVGEQQDDRGVSAGDKIGSGAVGEQRARICSRVSTSVRGSGTFGGRTLTIGEASTSPSRTHQAKNCRNPE